MTRCVACGGPMKTKREKAYRYAECGLPNVILENAVEVATCTKCGEAYTGVPAIEGLHRAVAAGLIRKKRRLAPEEIKFLRKSLGWSGVDFAKRMGAAPETVSRCSLASDRFYESVGRGLVPRRCHLSSVSERRGTSPRPTRTSIVSHDQSTRLTRAIVQELSGLATFGRREEAIHYAEAPCGLEGDRSNSAGLPSPPPSSEF